MHTLRKLRAMRPTEIVGRIGQAATLTVERYRFQHDRLVSPDRLRRAVLPEFASRWPLALLDAQLAPTRPVFAGLREKSQMRHLFATRYAAESEVARTCAARAARGEFEFFGRSYRAGLTPDWHADPVSGRRWPAVFHADAERVMPPPGDVKDVWELNRHQFIVDLAKAVFLFDDEEAWHALRTLVLHWLDSVPYATGIPWGCALEPAYRALAWIWAMWLCADRLASDPQFHLRWCEGLYDHGRFLHGHLELYSSPFNHLIGEATVLYLLGLAMPEVAVARRWRRRGRRILLSRLPMQFHADGGSTEQATFYHHATLGFYLLAGVAGRHRGHELPSTVWATIERATEFSMWMTQPDGCVPAIGDTDDAKSLFLERRRFWDFRHFLSCGAVLFERRDLKFVAGGFWEDALWLLGPAALKSYDVLPAQAPNATAVALRASGYAIMRDSWSSTADFLTFDCGEQAAGLRQDEVQSAAHGHADCLSVTVCLGGHPVLVDAGYLTYNGERAWERFFRETAAHNTARVDNRDQALHLEKMAWSHAPRARWEQWVEDEAGPRAVGSHDGYEHGALPVTHRRAIWLRQGGLVLVLDEFAGAGSHDVELNYLFAAGTELVRHDQLVTCSARGWALTWGGDVDLTARVATGQSEPGGGWMAPSLGVKHPAPRLTLGFRMNGPRVRCMTVLSRDLVHAQWAATRVVVHTKSFIERVQVTDNSLVVSREVGHRREGKAQLALS